MRQVVQNGAEGQGSLPQLPSLQLILGCHGAWDGRTQEVSKSQSRAMFAVFYK